MFSLFMGKARMEALEDTIHKINQEIKRSKTSRKNQIFMNLKQMKD
jgi:hypothetical protein